MKMLIKKWLSIPTTHLLVHSVSTTFSKEPYSLIWPMSRNKKAVPVFSSFCNIFYFVHNPVWELHIWAATPPSLLFSLASMTNLVGHNILNSFVDSHKKHKLRKDLHGD